MNNINFYGMRTIILMKLMVFIKEFKYSIIAPIISSIIFLTILKTISDYYNLGSSRSDHFMNFIVPGIIIMIIIQETYANISETLIHMKQIGSFNDILISPISRVEIALSFIIATLFIGLILSIINLIIINLFIDIHFYNIFRIFYYLSITSLIFGSIGSLIGFVSYTWDVQQSFFSFLISPISLLSGTFFSIATVENFWENFLLLNPFYHLVSNFRKGFNINQSYSLNTDIILLIIGFIFVYSTIFVFRKGYKVIH